ncbi:MAG: AEC family transporter [Eubacteriales bacterium]
MIFKSVTAVISVFFMIGIGVLAAKLKWVNKEVANFIPKIIINVSLPCQLIVTFSTEFTKEQLSTAWVYVAAGIAASLAGILIAYIVALLIKIPKSRRGVFCVLFALSNSVFIGFPVASAIFGNPGMQYASFFYIANTTCFWTFGYAMITNDAEVIHGETQSLRPLDRVKKILSIPILTLIASFILILLNVSIPELITNTAGYLGGLTTPLSTLFLGYTLYNMGKKMFKYDKGMISYIIGRFPVSFMLMYLSCLVFGIEGLARNVLLTQMSLPAMIQTVVTSEYVGADSDYAARGLAITTLLSLFTIPLFSFLGS